MSTIRQSTPRTTWPIILTLLLAVFVAMLFPGIQREVLADDIALTRWFNSLLGHSATFDLFIGGLNSKAGDVMVALSFLAFFGINSSYQWNRKAVCRKLAFWSWTTLLFVLLYQGQRVMEIAFDRDSPSRVLEGWFNIRKAYHIDTKYQNTHSYPSGHSMAYYFVAFMALRRSLRTGLILLVVALAMPTTRIMIGAHWASDIFLGSVPLAFFFAALFYETRVYRLNVLFETILNGLWHVTLTRHRRSLRNRLQDAWVEFVRGTPQGNREPSRTRGPKYLTR